ncbi:hypothetical protein [Citrobacter freundii]|uniref:hypothetical protein n=1 Tax=Citrobacter freundii TaxID=546 RepID=UPI0024DEAACA|nr:hypothetical protein [Citrobacter freundii]MDK2369821.1 hypothetical protein [Citrobacter freundii]
MQTIDFRLLLYELIIAWSLVQVQQGPPNFKDLREIAGPFSLGAIWVRKVIASESCSSRCQRSRKVQGDDVMQFIDRYVDGPGFCRLIHEYFEE